MNLNNVDMYLNNRIGSFRLRRCVIYRRRLSLVSMVIILFTLSACHLWTAQDGSTAPPGQFSPTENLDPTEIQAESTTSPSATSTPSATPLLPPLSPTNAPSPTHLATPDPYAWLTIDGLSNRDYGGGRLQVQEILAVNSYFTRTLVTYPSDGLTIYGFMNIPRQPRPNDPSTPSPAGHPTFPVIIALHGYIDPNIYETLDYTTRYADALARSGFIVIHPNLRGYPPSDSGDDLFRTGMALDVLNLIGIIKEQAGQPGLLERANPQAIGLWGHSMGGGISTRVITISPDVDAVVLYGAMGADDQRNYERIYSYFSNGTRGIEELQTPAQEYLRISPLYYLDRIQASVSIHHGKNDVDVPLTWSLDLCNRLSDLGKTTECFTYPDQAHTFHGSGDELFIQRMIDFYQRNLGK